MDFFHLEQFIYKKLEHGLSDRLYYHSIGHVRDVMSAAKEIASYEKINNDDLLLLKTAVLFHDIGFIFQSADHEEIGCKMVWQILPGFGYNSDEMEIICGMVMSTKIPQSPKNHLEEIICDADLDYLGRDDYWKISNNLFREINESETLGEKEWIKIQINFLEQHKYFTSSSIKSRQAKKNSYIRQLKEMLDLYK